ncbi:hypothetical protein LCM20_01715 [Halobacillus litoralis]|uniref:hypothetical protein n=1 Tax=Halobacillus litoralis TaxID=45668 RepID=UPI001CD368F5|nr:hypothetical protein [Halobacillus litoralis]MCA0969304.1 hypothetical protein [Halobacillus litoralis]
MNDALLFIALLSLVAGGIGLLLAGTAGIFLGLIVVLLLSITIQLQQLIDLKQNNNS